MPAMRWMLVMILAMLLVQALHPWLRKMGLGRLPLDFHFKARGRSWYLPIGSSMLLSFVALAIGYFI